MNPEAWSIISMGIVILIAVATSNRSLRRDMSARFDKMGERIDKIDARIDAVQQELGARIDRLGARIDNMGARIDAVQRDMGARFDAVNKRIDEMGKRLGEMGDRLARVEGLLEGMGLARWKRPDKSRGDVEDPPPLPRQ